MQIQKKEDKREQKLYALVKEMNKKIKKFEKRTTNNKHSESNSDLIWRQRDTPNLGTPMGKRKLHVKRKKVSSKKSLYKKSTKNNSSVKVKNSSIQCIPKFRATHGE